MAGKDGAVEDEAVSAARAAVGGGSGAWEGSEGSSREEAVKRMAGVAGTVIAAAEVSRGWLLRRKGNVVV